MAMTFKDEDLKRLLAEVSADLEKAMAHEANELRKDFPDEEPGSSAPPPADASAPEGSAGSASASPAPADGSAGPEASVSPDASGGAPGADPAADAAVDPEALKQEYLKLGPEGLKVHMMAIQAAAMELTGGGAPAGQPAAPGGMPPASPAPSPSPAPAPGMMKEERLASVQPKGKITNGPDRLDAIAVHKSEIETLKSTVDLLSKAVHEMVGKPIRKAVTEIPFTGKPDTQPEARKTLTKAEITAKLNQVTSRRDLAKSDRQRINAYYDGAVTIEGISDLLK